jgi:hypothetical protein
MSQIHADLTRLMTLSDWRLCRRRRRRFLGGFRPSRHPNDRKETRIQQYIKSQMALFAFIGNFRRRPIQTASLRTCSTWTVFRSILKMPPHSFFRRSNPDLHFHNYFRLTCSASSVGAGRAVPNVIPRTVSLEMGGQQLLDIRSMVTGQVGGLSPALQGLL